MTKTFWDCLGKIKSRMLKTRNSRIRKQNPKSIKLKNPKAYVERSSYTFKILNGKHEIRRLWALIYYYIVLFQLWKEVQIWQCHQEQTKEECLDLKNGSNEEVRYVR